MFKLIFWLVQTYDNLVKRSLKTARTNGSQISPRNRTAISLLLILSGGIYGLATASGIGGLLITFFFTMSAFYDLASAS
jgi:hypothetical protein